MAQQLITDFCATNPRIGNNRFSLKFCALYRCLRSFSHSYTDRWSPLPIMKRKGLQTYNFKEFTKLCISDNKNKDRGRAKQQTPWETWYRPIPAFILSSVLAKSRIILLYDQFKETSFQPVGKFFTEFSPEDVQCSVKVQVVVFKIIIIKIPRAALVSYDMRSLVML